MWENEELLELICQAARDLQYVPYTTTEGFRKALAEGPYAGWRHDTIHNVRFIYDEVYCDRRVNPKDLRKIADIIDLITNRGSVK